MSSFKKNIHPLLLKPCPVTTIWGGTKLYDIYGKGNSSCDKIGETWELSVENAHECAIQNGIYKGRTLSEYIKAEGGHTVSRCYKGDRFPVLIKFIDSADKLSVQVHPDDKYAHLEEGENGKTEMWYVISADPDAEIVYGLRSDVNSDRLREAVLKGDLDQLLNRVRVKVGDVFFLPAGMIHAIGGGILVAEVQQNSDTTYRVYDYDRVGADGLLRELHVDKALEVIKSFDKDQIYSRQFECNRDPSKCGELLAACNYFFVEKIVLAGQEIALDADGESFHALLCINGNGKIIYAGEQYEFADGNCYFIPANMGSYGLLGNAEMLRITL